MNDMAGGAKGGRLARVVAVQEDLVTLRVTGGPAAYLVKNEVAMIAPSADPHARLMAEVLRVRGGEADAQVYESTSGIAVGDGVELTGAPLSVQLGPGMLGQVYDGLQNPLEDVAIAHGVFLPRGQKADPLPAGARWPLHVTLGAGKTVRSGDCIGWVEERGIRHHIFAPFDLQGDARIVWIEEAAFAVDDVIGEVADSRGERRPLKLSQKWPVRRSLAAWQTRVGRAERRYPREPLVTTQRIIDTFFPIAKGGTACIPGPFGAGKTILQNLIARFSDADIVIFVACGERAGEVVEMMGEFARLRDPRGGGALMDRTIIICNTSAMPVAAREASIHTGATIAEYYREMGLSVLLLADSTSRWAQALREIAGRLEEIPGEEAYPAYIGSEIKSFYQRAGVIARADGTEGALTIIGAVSPAGGNFEEPVTQETLATVKCFLGLSAERAYKRFYPAIDPLQSWSRYPAQLKAALAKAGGEDWDQRVARALDILKRGDEVAQLMQVAGEEGVTMSDLLTYHKAQFLDAAYLQQDAFDAVDASVPFAQQAAAFARVEACLEADLTLSDRDAARAFFTRLTAAAKALNYARPSAPDHAQHLARYEEILAEARA